MLTAPPAAASGPRHLAPASMRHAFAVLAGLAGLAGLGLMPNGAAAQRYVAPTRETVFSTTQESQGDAPVHLIYVENRSTVPVTVFSVSLSRCENVRQQCYPRPVRIRVQPGRRELATRVEPANRALGFTYFFGFGWNADSAGVAALATLASGGNTRAQDQLASLRRADSLERTATGPHGTELTRDDFTALAGRALTLRAVPDSLLLVPGERASVDRIRVFVADSQGVALGRTRWLRWQVPYGPAVQFVPPEQLTARGPGRVVFRFQLAEEAQGLLRHPVAELEVPVRVAYPADPHAPTFAGVAVDADHATPLACADVGLEDSAGNVVTRARTDAAGAFRLPTPRPGTYRVRVETRGWAPVYGPTALAHADETPTQRVPVRFTEQLLTGRSRWTDADEFQHASPAAVATGPIGAPWHAVGTRAAAASTPVVSGVTLGGSESFPVLGIIGRVPVGTTWMQFVVDSAGRVDPASLLLPAGTPPTALASVRAMLPRVRFSPARAAGRATCEMQRMQVTFRAP